MKTARLRSLLVLLAGLAAHGVTAQTYVTPKMGGGQVPEVYMIHIDLYYDDAANVFHAYVDDSYGIPELIALDPGYAFDPLANYAVLNGKAYNAQYGWNLGGYFDKPPGTAIWIEQTNASPGLEVYQDWGRLGSYAPIFGTAGSSRLWRWDMVMVHNTYAVRAPTARRFFADYHIYFGDATTGSRTGFTHLDDTSVHLEWTTVPVEDPLAFKFGAAGLTNGAPLRFLNAPAFLTNAGFVVNLRSTNAGPCAQQYEGGMPLVAIAATAANGGPVTNHAACGSCLELQVVSLAGPTGASLGFWEADNAQPRFSLPTGTAAGTNRIRLSETQGEPGADPYGCIQGRRFAVTQPGLYCLGFRIVDTSRNGLGGGPIHAPSELYRVHLQAGLTLDSLVREGPMVTARFGGEPALRFYLESAPALGSPTAWTTVAGPLAGTNHLQTLCDTNATNASGFYRLRAEPE